MPLAPRPTLPTPATPTPAPAPEPLDPELPLMAAVPATPVPIAELPAVGIVDKSPDCLTGVLPQPKPSPVSSMVNSARRAIVFIVWLLLHVGHELRCDARHRGSLHHIKPFS
jgi:hypothetical protein